MSAHWVSRLIFFNLFHEAHEEHTKFTKKLFVNRTSYFVN